LVIDAGAEVNAVDYAFQTPLHVAAKEGRLGTVRYLLSRADCNVLATSMGKTAEELASQSGHVHVANAIQKEVSNESLARDKR
jgi:ankyrin repeat protein